MSRPRLLDLFCGAGGAAVGYHRAGFDVVGVDNRPQPHYPFQFVKADALLFVEGLGAHWGGWELEEFDAIHASPPCQAYSSLTGRWARQHLHPDLVAMTRELLQATGLPYVIENVEGAPLENPARLCGSWFGLDLHRHRLFETNWPLMSTPCSHHWQRPRFRSLDKRQKGLAAVVGVHGHVNYAGERELREQAMGIDWMTPAELVEAIPPAYTELIGHQLMQMLEAQSLRRSPGKGAGD
jgi:DNA (cytosine-5)-methyltransferase 1